MATRAKTELVVCGGLALCSLAISFFLAKRPTGIEQASSRALPERALTALEPAAAQKKVRALINSGARSTAIWAALEDCDSAELAELSAFAKEPPISRASRLNQLLITARWCELDPAAATDASAHRWDGITAVPTAVGIWAELDPLAALDYMKSAAFQTGSYMAYDAIASSARQLGGVDIDALFAQMPTEQTQRRWLDELTADGNLSTLKKLADPDENLAHFGDYPAHQSSEIAKRALRDGHPVDEVLATFSGGSNRRLGGPDAGLLKTCYEHDPAAAVDWIFGQGDPFNAVRYGEKLVRELVKDQPEKAVDVLARLPESGSRSRLLLEVAGRVRATGSEQFEDWRAGLDAADKAEIDERMTEGDEG